MDDPASRLILPGGPRILKGADGTLRLVGNDTATVTVDRAHPGGYRVRPEDMLLAAARMRRDGMSLPAIRKELDVMPHVTDRQIEAFLNVGLQLLDQRIAEGLEPAETVTKVTVDADLAAEMGQALDITGDE